ncbi:ATPase [Acidipropionibacterium acidipropionici]|uniref:ATPase n=1 Tax=Acidipropionibacterium acidipropionici TaxID=1748 RepID=A0AAC8YF46_9ACTN|nr:SRPBCC domain-containing protein [Acidipropionibacterium acidipropionici]AMS05512.1 ATPase [Acidipropionibacterium acidipropionici]AOZ46985.1 ATPase [Acidipropionibacterium acidipropionici]AZP36921.1 ATPase [Acidipropionibacterium acidipropionici]
MTDDNTPTSPDDEPLTELSFTVSGRVSRPVAEVYEAVADPDQLSHYFTTGGARGRLESGATVSWDFHDFPGRFPVTVVEATPPDRIEIRWGADKPEDGLTETTVVFEFSPIDEGRRTLVTITESAWRATGPGARNAFGNCEGWTGMLAALKVWVEHGINLREGFYA